MKGSKHSAIRVRLGDIAKAVGVSTMSVSLALRGLPGVSGKTRKRIVACAKKVGYRPDPALTALAAYRHRIRKPSGFSQLAFITNYQTRDEWRQSFVGHFFEGAEARAREFGYELVHYWLREDGLPQHKASSVLYNRGIKGLVIAPVMKGSSHLNMTWRHFSSVAIGCSIVRPQLHYVMFDHHHAMKIVFHKLRDKGYSRIGLAFPYHMSQRARHFALDAYLGEQFRFPRGADIQPLLPLPSALQGSLLTPGAFPMDAFLEWISKNRLDAVITTAPWASLLLEEGPIRAPKDIGLACFSRYEDAPHPISGVIEDLRLIGATAVDQLHLQLLRNESGLPENPQGTLIQGKWREGTTLRKNRKSSASATKSLFHAAH